MKFDDYFQIPPEIKKSLEKAGFRKPTDIQYKAIPNIFKGEDLLAIAQTGTGKTAAFAIPILSMLNEIKRKARTEGIRCVVMVPTRELAIQISEVFQEIGRHTRVNTFSVFGGVEQGPQIAKLEKGIDVLVSTPGRMFDLVSQGYIKLDKVETLVLDEADHMLDLGFIDDIRDLIKKLPRKRQTLFFSATIDDEIKKLAYSLVTNPIRIQVSPKDPVSKNVTHAVAFVEMDDKRFFLERMVRGNQEAKILVFVRTKVRAERVFSALQRVNIETQTIHGDKDQADRFEVMRRFKKGLVNVLIATDVSARGIDIPNVDFVVNYDLPEQPENYVHRVGRTGRGVNKGEAVSFCSKEELPLLKEIEAYIGKPVSIIGMTIAEYEALKSESEDTSGDLKSLMGEIEKLQNKSRKKKK